MKKPRLYYLSEYAVARFLMAVVSALPYGLIRGMAWLLGNILYFASAKRRGIALENLRAALGREMDEKQIRRTARQSCASFFLTFLEFVKLRPLLDRQGAISNPKYSNEKITDLFKKARAVHDEAGGCIFVTPHIGNWELLTHASAAVGIPLVVVARPPDNPYLRKLLFEGRTRSGQVIIPKKNAIINLKKALRQGRSLGLLPDQSTKMGIPSMFFGRKALTTPVPAVLAVTYKRPIVVAACLRATEGMRFEGFVSEPIQPGDYESEKEEVIRLTDLMNRTMEDVIRRYPGQYLWIHNRWKTYAGKKGFFSQK